MRLRSGAARSFRRRLRIRRLAREADLSTQQAGAQAPPWLSRPLGDGRWPQGDRRPPRARPQEALRLIRSPRLRPSGRSPVGSDAVEWSLDTLRDNGRPGPSGEPLGRLTRRAEFQRVARGRRVPVETFTLQSRRREGAERETVPGARVGLTVTRNVGGAVERNRVRRRLKEALRVAAPLEAEGDHDYVLVARREALGRRFAALVDDVRTAFRAARRRGADNRGRGRADRTAKDRDTRT
jgi:ribonuclease P protein component